MLVMGDVAEPTTGAEPAGETPEQLVAHLRELIAEAEKTLSSRMGEQSHGRMAELSSRIDLTREKLEAFYGRARKTVAAGARKTDDAIRAHPYATLGLALGAGILLGALLARTAERER